MNSQSHMNKLEQKLRKEHPYFRTDYKTKLKAAIEPALKSHPSIWWAIEAFLENGPNAFRKFAITSGQFDAYVYQGANKIGDYAQKNADHFRYLAMDEDDWDLPKMKLELLGAPRVCIDKLRKPTKGDINVLLELKLGEVESIVGSRNAAYVSTALSRLGFCFADEDPRNVKFPGTKEFLDSLLEVYVADPELFSLKGLGIVSVYSISDKNALAKLPQNQMSELARIMNFYFMHKVL